MSIQQQDGSTPLTGACAQQTPALACKFFDASKLRRSRRLRLRSTSRRTTYVDRPSASDDGTLVADAGYDVARLLPIVATQIETGLTARDTRVIAPRKRRRSTIRRTRWRRFAARIRSTINHRFAARGFRREPPMASSCACRSRAILRTSRFEWRSFPRSNRPGYPLILIPHAPTHPRRRSLHRPRPIARSLRRIHSLHPSFPGIPGTAALQRQRRTRLLRDVPPPSCE